MYTIVIAEGAKDPVFRRFNYENKAAIIGFVDAFEYYRTGGAIELHSIEIPKDEMLALPKYFTDKIVIV